MSRNFATVALPWDGTLRGFLATKDDKDVIRSSVLWIVLTRKGERVMLRDFGTILPDQLFEPNDAVFEQDAVASVRDALRTEEDRVKFDSMDIVRDQNNATAIIKFLNVLDTLHQDVQTLRVSPTLVLAR